MQTHRGKVYGKVKPEQKFSGQTFTKYETFFSRRSGKWGKVLRGVGKVAKFLWDKEDLPEPVDVEVRSLLNNTFV